MSERPPQSLKELVERVPDVEARRTFQALVQRIEELESELRKRDEVIRATHGFLRSTFRTTYDDYRRASKGPQTTAAPVAGTEPVPLDDHEELTAARSRDDFLEVCRRAFKLVEKTTYTFLSAARTADGDSLAAAWAEQQAGKAEATKDLEHPHTARPLPSSWEAKEVYIVDLIETAFLILYGDRYRKGTPQTDNAVRDRYFTILTVRDARNPSSHGHEQDATVEERLEGIRSSWRRQEALKLYRTRDTDGYDRLLGPVVQYDRDAREMMAAWASTTAEAEPSSEASDP